jgi:hypothetical protein
VEQHSATPLVLVQPFKHAQDLKSSTLKVVSADAHLFNNADVDSSSTRTLAHVPQTQLPDAHQPFTSTTLKCATVFAELNNNAFAVQPLSMPLADAQPHHLVKLHKFTILSLVNADAQLLHRAVADSSSALSHAHALLTHPPDAPQLSMLSTPVSAIADAESLLNAFAAQLLSTRPVSAHHSHHALPHKCSIKLHADADAHQSNNAVADSSSTQPLAHAYLIQLLDVCPTFTDSTPPDATVCA